MCNFAHAVRATSVAISAVVEFARASRTSMRALVIGGACLVAIVTAGPAAASDRGNGKILFTSNRSGEREIYTVNRDGSGVSRLTINNLLERNPVWSPDGTAIAFAGQSGDGNFDIYTIRADGSGLTRLTTDPARDDDPTWTADGRQVVYDRGIFSAAQEIRAVAADGRRDHVLDLGPGNNYNPDPAPHGHKLVFSSDRTGVQGALFVSSLDGGPAKQITSGPFDYLARWAPDGKQVAFDRDVGAGESDLYVVGANGKGPRQLTSTPDFSEFGAAWAPDGSELLFFGVPRLGGDYHLYSVSPSGGTPTTLSTSLRAPFLETFDGGVVDSSRWYTIADSGGSVGIVNGRVEEFISHDADPTLHNFNQVDEQVGLKCRLDGDFDYQVDYKLVSWPAHNGFFAMLNAIFGGGAVARTSAQWDPPYDEQYGAWTEAPTFTFDGINTTDTSGQMRLVRRAGVLYAYARGGPSVGWVLIHSGPASGSTIASMELIAPLNTFTHQDGLVAYDNFRLNSGALACPGTNEFWVSWQGIPARDGSHEGGDDGEEPQTKTLAFASGSQWTTYGQNPGATLAGAGQGLGPAQRVCMSVVAPPSCAAGATVYASPFSGWTADLTPIPGAAWIWAPGIDGSSPTADLAHFFFAKRFVLDGQPTEGTLYLSVDDFAALWVNGVRVGAIGSITDSSLAGRHTFLTKFDITSYLRHGPNVITIEAQNGPAYFSGLCSTCTYALNPAGVVFGGTLTYIDGESD